MQRVSLARALATEPALLLLDEPAAGLDPESRHTFLADVEQALADRASTVVHVTHRAEEALRLADRVAVLVAGELRQLDTPAALTCRPKDATVARLVGYENVLQASVDGDGVVRLSGLPVGLSCSGHTYRGASRLPPGASLWSSPSILTSWRSSRPTEATREHSHSTPAQ